jgi:hypothetical protein
MMLDARDRFLTQVVDSQAVFVGIDLLQQVVTEFDKLLLTNGTLKYGQLHPLTVIEANTSDSSQTPPPCRTFRGNIIGNKHQHDQPPSGSMDVYLRTRAG